MVLKYIIAGVTAGAIAYHTMPAAWKNIEQGTEKLKSARPVLGVFSPGRNRKSEAPTPKRRVSYPLDVLVSDATHQDAYGMIQSADVTQLGVNDFPHGLIERIHRNGKPKVVGFWDDGSSGGLSLQEITENKGAVATMKFLQRQYPDIDVISVYLPRVAIDPNTGESYYRLMREGRIAGMPRVKRPSTLVLYAKTDVTQPEAPEFMRQMDMVSGNVHNLVDLPRWVAGDDRFQKGFMDWIETNLNVQGSDGNKNWGKRALRMNNSTTPRWVPYRAKPTPRKKKAPKKEWRRPNIVMH